MRQEEPLKLWEAGWGCFSNHFHFRTVGLRECPGIKGKGGTFPSPAGVWEPYPKP